MNIIIFGPQGSGKGTQARLLAEKMGLYHLESGRLLREIAQSNPTINKIINQKGKLLPDGIIFSLITEHLEKEKPERDGIIFDGYPRSEKQYGLLKEWLEEKGQKIDQAVFLRLGREMSIKRLSARRVCPDCGTKYNLITKKPPVDNQCQCGGKLIQRPDDEPAAIEKRLSVYQKNTQPLIQVFKKEGKLFDLDGERPIEVILDEILTKIGGKNA